jgi:hypothetical protein
MRQTITFEVITEKMLNVVLEIVHSNKSYNSNPFKEDKK